MDTVALQSIQLTVIGEENLDEIMAVNSNLLQSETDEYFNRKVLNLDFPWELF